MNKLADIVESNPLFSGFDVTRFRHIPNGDAVFGPLDYANRALDRLYDFADDHRIWID